MTLKAFHNDIKIKNKYVNRILAHAEADALVQGMGWENGKGCAVGCTLEAYNHALYPIELGIPEWLAHLEDHIFEKLPKERAMLWPEQFLSVINIGANLEMIKAPFLIYVLESTLDRFDNLKFPAVKEAITKVISLYKNPDPVPEELAAIKDAAYAADVDASAAYASAAYASVAYHVAVAAAVDAAAGADAAAVTKIKYIKFADKLIELLRDCKPQ